MRRRRLSQNISHISGRSDHSSHRRWVWAITMWQKLVLSETFNLKEGFVSNLKSGTTQRLLITGTGMPVPSLSLNLSERSNMDYRVTFEFNDMDVSKPEMRKELEFLEEHLADKYDADLYHIRIEPID